jgi:hypothetical protein
MSFNLDNLFIPLSFEGAILVLSLGLVMGLVIASANHRLTPAHAYWMMAGGIVFFVPLSMFRGIQGVASWERILAYAVFWSIYVAGMYVGGIIFERARK